MSDGSPKVEFDLSIKLPNIEFKKPNVSIQDFLEISDREAEPFEGLFSVSHHLNLAELIIDELFIEGDLYGQIDVVTFIDSLKNCQDRYDTKWVGSFDIYSDGEEFCYTAPSFNSED